MITCLVCACSNNSESEETFTSSLIGQNDTTNTLSTTTHTPIDPSSKDDHKTEDPMTNKTTQETKTIDTFSNDTSTQAQSIAPAKEIIKLLGRSLILKDVLWMSHAGTGGEFEFEGDKLALTFIQDDQRMHSSPDQLVRIGVFLDGTQVIDFMLDEAEKEIQVINNQPTKATVSIVKLSESQISSAGLKTITFNGAPPTRSPEKKLKIEFIGDSITNGYGVDGTLDMVFSTQTENATKALAYRTAKALDADYSLVAFSGHGLVSGYTGTGDINTSALVQPYYNKLGAGGNTMVAGLSPKMIDWQADDFVPDIIVINLGTNDQSYTLGVPDRIKAYQAAYKDFLKEVRAIHPESYIICSLGLMGDDLYPAIEKMVEAYKDERGDEKISTCHLSPQQEINAYGVDWHPSYRSHQLAANELVQYIQNEILPVMHEGTLAPSKLVAFTFDDGPNTTTTSQVLDVLEANLVPATFFVIGNNISEKTVPIMERGHALGCEYANHSYSHSNMAGLEPAKVLEELEVTTTKIHDAIGLEPLFFRPPYLATSSELFETVPMPFIGGIAATDWEPGVDTSARVKAILDQVTDGSIVLLHDMTGNDQTVEAIKILIPTLKSKGYEFVTVSELFRRRNMAIDAEDTRLHVVIK